MKGTGQLLYLFEQRDEAVRCCVAALEYVANGDPVFCEIADYWGHRAFVCHEAAQVLVSMN